VGWQGGWRGAGVGRDATLCLGVVGVESYERAIQSLEGSITEAEEDLDNTR
jgi:hypothetical protein